MFSARSTPLRRPARRSRSVAGGRAVYEAALASADVLVVTEVDLVVDGDTAAPRVGPGWRRDQVGEWVASSQGPRFRVVTWTRSNP